MTRAERRRANRENQKKVTMTQGELNAMREEIIKQTSEYTVDALMSCFALSERRLYNFGRKRILRSLKRIDVLMHYISEGVYTPDDYKKIIEEEAGIKIGIFKKEQ